ncbi:MAG: Uma2 family endonuclease [Planctomycetota bacterium]
MGTIALRVGPGDAGLRLSSEEFASALTAAPFIYERVNGRLVVMSPAGPEHRRISRPFRRELGLYWGTHPELVDDVDVEGWVSTSEDDDRIPDICVYLAGESSDEVVPLRVPDVIFEFVSADRSDQERDYIDKRLEYHRIGVKEYIIVDRFKQAILILLWQPSDYAEQILGREATYTTPLLPGLQVALGEVFDS